MTEGGYGVLYAAGAALASRRGDDDDLIARACQRVLDDEFNHVLQGIAGADAVDDEHWALLSELCVAQSATRIHMRDEQFGHRRPGPPRGAGGRARRTGRLQWERSGFAPPHQPSATASMKSATASR